MPESTREFPKEQPLERRAEDLSKDSFSPEWETNTAISRILGVALKPVSFRQQLEEILEVIVSISWLGALKKGAIFVANDRAELVLAVHQDLAPALETKCASVAFGKCLCGRAALLKQVLFKSCVDEEHEITFEGMAGHGHYNIPLLGGGDEVIGVLVLYLEDHHHPHEEEGTFIEMLGRTVASILTHRNLDLYSEIGRIQLQHAHVDIMTKLVAATEHRDSETGNHLKRMSRYSVIIGQTIGLSTEDLDLLRISAPMHDIGKVGIPDEILMKPGKLTEDEYTIMKGHSEIGAHILSGENALMRASREVALGHHEKWDGSGYPQGKAGKEIPLFARICALADVFDALTTRRPYKEPWSLDRTLELVRSEAGHHFDPALVEALLLSIDEVIEVASIFCDIDDDASHLQLRGSDSLRSDSEPPLRFDEIRETGITGIEEVVRLHRFVLDIAQRLETASTGMDTRELFECLNSLQKNLPIYFVNEENLMRQHGYPDTEEHARDHQRFADMATQFMADLETAPLAASFAASRSISQWVRDHLNGHGSAFLDFLREQES